MLLRKTKISTIISLSLLTLCSGAQSVSALTYSSNVDVQFTFNPTLSLTLSSNDLVIPDLAPGTASDSNIITVNIKTNNITGYTINATVGNNTTFDTRDLKHQNSNVVNKFTSVNFGTIVATNTALTDNTWGYSYSLDNGTTWIANTASSTSAGYSGLPLYNDETNIATLKESTAPSATTSGDDIKFKIAARASNEQPSGEYNNVINFTTVVNPEPQPESISCSGPNVICYSANTLGLVEGSMGEQDVDDSNNSLTGGSTVTLLASNFSREGYGFAGWNTEPDYSGTFYGSQETITTPADMSGGLALYAVWVPSAGSMQNDAEDVCDQLVAVPARGVASLASVSALTDERDNQTYTIAKFPDNKCWMTENLRLDDSASLTISNTNNPLNNGIDAILKHNYTDSDTYNTLSPSTNAIYDATTAPDGWCFQGTSSCFNQSRLMTDNTSDRDVNPSTLSAKMYSYGNYYNLYSATAGQSSTTIAGYDSADGDICPFGWRLPQYYHEQSYGDFSDIINAIDREMTAQEASSTVRSFPYSFVLGGARSYAVDMRVGNIGTYWTSTNSSYTERAYFAILYTYSFVPNMLPFSGSNKSDGYSIRCISAT